MNQYSFGRSSVCIVLCLAFIVNNGPSSLTFASAQDTGDSKEIETERNDLTASDGDDAFNDDDQFVSKLRADNNDEGSEEPSSGGISPRLSLLPAAINSESVREGSGEVQSEQRKCFTCDSKAQPATPSSSGMAVPPANLSANSSSHPETCCDAPREDQLKAYMAPAGYEIYCYTLYDSQLKERVVSRGVEYLSEPKESGCFRSLGDQHMCMCKESDGCNDDVTVDNGIRCKVAIPYNKTPGGTSQNGSDGDDDGDESQLVVFDPDGTLRQEEPETGASRDSNGASAVGSKDVSLTLLVCLVAYLCK